MNRRRFLFTSAGIFVPTIVRGINPVMIPRLTKPGVIPAIVMNTTKVGAWAPAITKSGKTCIWNYGDGTALEVANTSTHTFASAGTKVVRTYITDSPDTITIIDINTANITSYSPQFRFKNLSQFYCYVNAMSNLLPHYDEWSLISWCQCHVNSFRGAIWSLTKCTVAQYFNLSSNLLTDYYAGTIATTLTTFLTNANLLPQSAVDQIGADFAANLGARPAVGTLSVGGTGNAAPSDATNYNAIAAHGWTVTHN